jgi:BirA family biotin operon repressor/biotin-[acetyl-CoA-carboxylase] ligase
VAATLSFATVIALGDVLSDLLPDRPVQHKWPNDLLIDGKKISGILLETAGSGTDRLDWLVIGLGVNIVSHPDQTLYPVTDLHGEGATGITAPDLLDRFLARFALHYDAWSQGGFAALLPAWKARAIGIGGDILVRLDNQTLEGRFVDLDGEGMLMLNMADGRTRRIAAGDVFLPGQMQNAATQNTGTANQG